MSDLEGLLRVQELDTAADQLRHRRANLPERALLEESLGASADADGAHAEATRRSRELAAAQERLEEEIAGLEARAEHVSRALSTGTVPRELQALQEELDGIRRRQRHLEDQELELMEQAEPVEADRVRLEAERTEHDGRAATYLAAIAEAEAAIDSELAERTSEREDAAAAVPAALLGEYESLRKRMGGVAAARLVGGTCQGCHLSLSAVEVDRIKHLPPDEPVHCEECGRLLVR
jgi:predicted  nucleic acid-binding Zn-ribbon protein